MCLLDYQPETKEIEFKGGSFRVKGLALAEITSLVNRFLPDLDKIIALAMEGVPKDGNFDASQAFVAATRVASEAPGLVANIIALASDTPGDDGVRAAGRLGAAKQIEALVEIGRLTFEEVGGVKKFMTWLIQIISSNLPAETQQKVLEKAPQFFSTKH